MGRDEIVKAIIGDLQERVNFATSDALSYVYLKDQSTFTDSDLGGGNFATAHAHISLLNLISKLHFCLHEEKPYIEPDLLEKAKDVYKSIKQSGKYNNDLLKLFRLPRPYEVNEQLAFCKLIYELKNKGIHLFDDDIDDEKIIEVWRGVRNKLAHVNMVMYKGFAVLAIDPTVKTNVTANRRDVLRYLKENPNQKKYKVFTCLEGNWLFCPDILTVKLEDILKQSENCVTNSRLSIKKLIIIHGAVMN